MDVVTLAPFRQPVLAEVVQPAAGPARVELKVEIVASQPPPPPAAASAAPQLPAPRAELPPSDALQLPTQRARAVAAYAARDPFQPRPGLIVDLRA